MIAQHVYNIIRQYSPNERAKQTNKRCTCTALLLKKGPILFCTDCGGVWGLPKKNGTENAENQQEEHTRAAARPLSDKISHIQGGTVFLRLRTAELFE